MRSKVIFLLLLLSAFICTLGARKLASEKALLGDAEALIRDPFSGATGSDMLGGAMGNAGDDSGLGNLLGRLASTGLGSLLGGALGGTGGGFGGGIKAGFGVRGEGLGSSGFVTGSGSLTGDEHRAGFP